MFSRARLAALVLLVAGVIAAVPGLASAQTTASFTVSANVLKHCEISAAGLNFGEYSPWAAADLDVDGALSVRCTKNTQNVTIALSDGGHAASGVRRMVNATDNTAFLSYELYRTTARSTRWGSTSGEQQPYTAASSGWTDLTVYGRITKGQDVPLGAYGDTVVATVNF